MSLRSDVKCADCGKTAPVHLKGRGKFRHPCCRSFHYFVQHKLWGKVAKYDPQLCLYCFRVRLGRDLQFNDFVRDAFWFNGVGYINYEQQKKRGIALQRAYIHRMVRYANSGKNTSKVW